MPFAFDMAFGLPATANTASTSAVFQGSMITKTTAGTPAAYITAVWAGIGGSGMTTAGGGYMFGNTWQTVGTFTTAGTPNAKNKQTGYTSGMATVINRTAAGGVGTGTQTIRLVINYAQTGGPGFWMAANPDMAVQVPDGGTVTGYFDFTAQTATTTETINGFWEWAEI